MYNTALYIYVYTVPRSQASLHKCPKNIAASSATESPFHCTTKCSVASIAADGPLMVITRTPAPFYPASTYNGASSETRHNIRANSLSSTPQRLSTDMSQCAQHQPMRCGGQPVQRPGSAEKV